MKEIKAFVKLFKAPEILHQLIDAGFLNITVSEAEGTGNLQNEDKTLSTKFSITNSRIAKIEIVCHKNDVDNIVSIISKYGRTGNPGDGIIYISDVQSAVRVKNGEYIIP